MGYTPLSHALECNNSNLQINARVARSREEHELDIACDQTINKLNLLEEEQFQSYAKEVIAEAISKDRNPYPLRKEWE